MPSITSPPRSAVFHSQPGTAGSSSFGMRARIADVQERERTRRALELPHDLRRRVQRRLRAWSRRDRNQDAAQRHRAVRERHESAHALGNEERHLARLARDRLGHRLAKPARTPVATVRGQHDQIGAVRLEVVQNGLHRVVVLRENLAHVDAELRHGGARAPGRQQAPSAPGSRARRESPSSRASRSSRRATP